MTILYALKLGRRYVKDVGSGDLGSLVDAQKFNSYAGAKSNIDNSRGEKVVKVEIRDIGIVRKGRPAA